MQHFRPCEVSLLTFLFLPSVYILSTFLALNFFSAQGGDCCPFIAQYELYFEFNVSAFSLDCAKSAFIISYLTGRARSWVTAQWSHRSAVSHSLPESLKTFTQIFQSTSPCREAAKTLLSLKRGKSVIDSFLNGLSESQRDHLAPMCFPADLEALINLA